jgi:hypothetical protein
MMSLAAVVVSGEGPLKGNSKVSFMAWFPAAK